VITDSGWQILTFASEMKSLTGKNLTFQTAPVITTAGHEDGQIVNLIDPAAIKKDVQSTFYPPTPAPQPTASKSTATSLPASATTVDVYNGGGTPGLAGQLSRALTSAGFKAGKVGNIASQSSNRVLYGTGEQASAAKIARNFGVTAAAGSSVAAGHVEVLLGTAATAVPAGIGSAASSASPASSPSPSPKPASSNGQVTVNSNAKFGIPCVY
jgi:hypothetical protein